MRRRRKVAPPVISPPPIPGLITLDAFRVQLRISPALDDERTTELLARLDEIDYRGLATRVLTTVLDRHSGLGGIVVEVERLSGRETWDDDTPP